MWPCKPHSNNNVIITDQKNRANEMEKAIPLCHKTNRPCLPLEANHNILHHWSHYWKEKNKQNKSGGSYFRLFSSSWNFRDSLSSGSAVQCRFYNTNNFVRILLTITEKKRLTINCVRPGYWQFIAKITSPLRPSSATTFSQSIVPSSSQIDI